MSLIAPSNVSIRALRNRAAGQAIGQATEDEYDGSMDQYYEDLARREGGVDARGALQLKGKNENYEKAKELISNPLVTAPIVGLTGTAPIVASKLMDALDPVAMENKQRVAEFRVGRSRQLDRFKGGDMTQKRSEVEATVDARGVLPGVDIMRESDFRSLIADMKRAERLVKMSGDVTQRILADIRLVSTIPVGEKTSAPVAVKSPLEKRAALHPLLGGLTGPPGGTASVESPMTGSFTSTLFRPRSRATGKGLNGLAHRVLDIIDNNLSSTETVVNMNGVPIGTKRKFLGGPMGAAVKLPLALGGLVALNAGYQKIHEISNKAAERARYNKAVEYIKDHPSFVSGEVGDMIRELGTDFDDVSQKGFKVLNEYAPSVAKNPQLAAEYLMRLIPDAANAMTGAEYAQRIDNLVKLEAGIQRNQPSIAGGAAGMAGMLL